GVLFGSGKGGRRRGGGAGGKARGGGVRSENGQRGPPFWTAGNRASINPALLRPPSRGRGAQVAQLVEHCTENAGVGGSIPPLGTSSTLRSPSPSFALVGIPSIHEHSCLRVLSSSVAGIRAFCWYFIGIKSRFGRRYQHAQRCSYSRGKAP